MSCWRYSSKMGSRNRVQETYWSDSEAVTRINITLKGSYYALFQSLDYVLGDVLEHALMLGGSKIALFFTEFTLLQYLSPQPHTNGSISSGFDEGPPSEKQNVLWLVSCPSALWLANSLDGFQYCPAPCQNSKFINIAISIQTSRILNKRIAQNLCTHGYCKTY